MSAEATTVAVDITVVNPGLVRQPIRAFDPSIQPFIVPGIARRILAAFAPEVGYWQEYEILTERE